MIVTNPMRVFCTLILLSSTTGIINAATDGQQKVGSLRRGNGPDRRLASNLPWSGTDLIIGMAGLDQTFPSIDTSGARTISISVDLTAEGRLEADAGDKQDTLKLYYKIDANPEVLWKDIAGETFSAQESVTFLAGNELTLRVAGKTSFDTEFYRLRNFRVNEGGPSLPSPVAVPSPVAPSVPSPVAAPTKNSPPVPTAGCRLSINGQNVDIGENGSDIIQTFDTSCLDVVQVSLDVSHEGNLDTSGDSMDTLQVYYKVDDGAEELWIDVAGDSYGSPNDSPQLVPGNLLTLRFTGRTTRSDEIYNVRNIRVYEPLPPPPTKAPVPLPPVAPSPQVCGVPKLIGGWKEPHGDFPISVVESHGSMIGTDFCIVSGFLNGSDDSTPNIYCIDTQNTKANWVKRVSLSDSQSIEGTKLGVGISHGAEAVVGSRLYMCGGFLGANPGPAIKDCWYYNHKSNTIHAITSIPQPRGGGVLMYTPRQNTLIFTAGAVRPKAGKSASTDYFNTWTYDLAQGDTGVWVSQDNIPFSGNHIMYTRAYDETGMERFYVMGGQMGEDERYGNIDLMYEYVPSKPKGKNQQWIQRKTMALKRGHANASTRAYGCGLIMLAGTTNRPTGKIDRIDYYDIPSNTWTQIGNLGEAENTPVCDIYADPDGKDWIWCTSPRSMYRQQRISI